MELAGLPACSAPLPWQQPAWERLGRQREEGRLPHALLLAGAAHIGKERLALALSRLLLCHQPTGGINCGKCHACELSAAGTHGDFRWVAPQEKSRVIKVDQVRQAIDFASRTAGQGAAKVVVISPAEAMNTNAANALLKCLEEPAADTFLLLVSARVQRIPATVRSRCQMQRLVTPSAEQSLAWLDQVTGERGESERWLDFAGGLPLLAESLYGSADAEKQVASRIACRALLAGQVGVGEAINMLEDVDLEQVLEQVADTVRRELRGAAAGQLQGEPARRLFALLDEIGGLQRAVAAGANPNRQLLCEVVLEKLHFLLGGPRAGGSILR
ncbi:DNA polymerase III subunit delta' [Mangrovimicrobium sediminis]|uniref:DNA-directed DNA polymerase n=1 Tax=Mangrovimicrobium sediminis TaxID=2562682 RepID=A0A4Z0M299_9GAMM|nr:DNA polymerase III subunit delta' [Haliea sp. SAOS-164]TGD73649.1 DNA polymerase III subunit delta' [Haliea sp. SAOS-164]